MREEAAPTRALGSRRSGRAERRRPPGASERAVAHGSLQGRRDGQLLDGRQGQRGGAPAQLPGGLDVEAREVGGAQELVVGDVLDRRNGTSCAAQTRAIAAASMSSQTDSCRPASARMRACTRFQRSAEATVPLATRGGRCGTSAGQPDAGGQGSCRPSSRAAARRAAASSSGSAGRLAYQLGSGLSAGKQAAGPRADALGPAVVLAMTVVVREGFEPPKADAS